VSIVQDLLRINTARNRRGRLPAVAAQFALGIVGLILIALVCVQLGFGLARTGFAYVILLALVSLFGSFSASVVLSVLAAACLNYFFAPPLFQLSVDIPNDLERIAVFLTTSLVVTALTTRLGRAADELRGVQAKWEKAERVAHFGWWERDFTTNHVTLSDEVSRIFGVLPVDLPDWHGRWLELIHPEDRTKAAETAVATLRPGGPRYDLEYRVVRPDGAVRVIRSHGDVTWDDSGRPLRQFGVLHDITELRSTEQELRASERRFRTFVDYAADGFFLFDDHATVLDVNRQACESLGYSREELIGKRPNDFDLALDEVAIERLRQRMLSGETVTFETRHKRKDGTSFPVEVRGGLIEQGGRRYLSLVRDITERKRAEEALRRSEAYLAEAQRLSHTGTSVYSAGGNLYWSDECYRLWDFDPLQGLPDVESVLQRIHSDDRDRVRKGIQKALRERGEHSIEFRIVCCGVVKHIEATSHPLLSAHGDIDQIVTTHVDVTERRRAQVQAERLLQLESDLAHMNRLSIMGELTASLAHEILHPIGTARNNARAGMRLLEMSPPNLSEVKEALGCVVRDADRAKDVVGRVRDHIRKAPPQRDVFDLNDAIHEVIVMVRMALHRNKVSVRTELMKHMAYVRGDRVQLQQVMLNLILNAVEAMSSDKVGLRELSISTEPAQTGCILVGVRDSGSGVEAAHLDQIFEPFYTTKTGGIGMGLSICRSIVDAHGGRLWTEANQPQGAVFQFTLPAVTESPEIASLTTARGAKSSAPDSNTADIKSGAQQAVALE
jgi:PAS domain S-box-containing protein